MYADFTEKMKKLTFVFLNSAAMHREMETRPRVVIKEIKIG